MTPTEENQYDIDRNQERLIMALGKLQEAKGLIDDADVFNSLDVLSGTLPIIGEEIDKQIIELKEIFGIGLTNSQTQTLSYSNAIEGSDENKSTDEKREVITDNFDLLGQLTKFMQDNDFTSSKAKMQTLSFDIYDYFNDKFSVF